MYYSPVGAYFFVRPVEETTGKMATGPTFAVGLSDWPCSTRIYGYCITPVFYFQKRNSVLVNFQALPNLL